MTETSTGAACARREAVLRLARCGAVLLAVFLAGGRAHADRALVETAALSALRQSAAVYLHVVDPESAGVPLSPLRLPGASSPAPPLVLPAARVCLAGSGPGVLDHHPGPGFPESVGSLFHIPGLTPVDMVAFRSEAGWREWPAAAYELPGYGLHYAAVAGVFEETGRGRLRVRRVTPDALAAYTEDEWTLPGRPVGVVFAVDDPEFTGTPVPLAASLCASGDGGGAVLSLCVSGTPEAQHFPLSEAPGWDPACADPRGLAVSPGGATVAAVVSGTSLTGAAGEPLSMVFFFQVFSRTWSALPVTLRGEASSEAVQFLRQDACRAGTTVPGTDFAYLARIDAGAGDEGWTKTGEAALTGAADGFLFSSSRDGGDTVAVALGRRLEIWLDGVRGTGPVRAFDAPVRALAWETGALFVGEASRLHRVSPETAEGPHVSLQSGHVTAVAPLPSTGEEDPHPDASRELAPYAVELRGAAAGRELRALPIGAEAGSQWTVEYDKGRMPWLVLYPRAGEGPGMVYLGADPARLPAAGGAEGIVRTRTAAGHSATTLVRVRMTGPPLARLLWVCPGGGGNECWPAVWSRLAGPPSHLAQSSVSVPLSGSLGAWRVVVANARALASGYFARQQLQGHVSGGGGLLVIGGEPETAAAMALWLAPFGMSVSASAPSEPPSGMAKGGGPLRFWPGIPASGSVGFTMLEAGPRPPGRPLADFHQVRDGDGPAVFMARAFGHGRVAALSSTALLDAAERGDAAAGRFIEQLAVWLARGPAEGADMDGDGLADDQEDVDGNGARDPGETDWLRDDSDGDGVPDGMEDWNRNGMVDPGETDPRNADSDGDGAWDGADPDPAPVYGTPYIAAVEPASGPAEGGNIVAVTGRGFSRNARLWFGNHRAEWSPVPGGLGALARVPESPSEEGTVDVRVEVQDMELNGVLPGGYRYTRRSLLSGSLVHEGLPQDLPDGAHEGSVRVILSHERRARVKAVLLTLPAPGIPGFSWVPERTGGAVRAEVSDDGTLLLLATPSSPLSITREGTVFATVVWRLAPGTSEAAVGFPAWGGAATADHGGRLSVEGAAIP